MLLHDRRVLLLGGTGGIGRAVREQLRAEGAAVIVATRRRAEGGTSDENAAVLDLEAADLDQQLAEVSGRHPDIDTVIHCAGQSCFGRLEDQTLADIDRQLAVNLRSAIVVARQFLPEFRRRGAGTLLFVGSVFGSIGFPGYTTYSASKYGLRGFCEALQREVADSGVTVMHIAPRATATDMNPERVDAMNRALGNRTDTPGRVAGHIVQALRSGKARTVIGWPEKLFVRINGLLPAVVDRAIRGQLPVIRRFIDREESS